MTSPEQIVGTAEDIYQRRDIEAAVALFEPDATIVWNGKEMARGTEAIRAFHERFFDPSIRNVRLSKKLIAASHDAIAVEWRATWDNPDGTRAEQTAAEHWDMKGGRIAEWRAFAVTKRIAG